MYIPKADRPGHIRDETWAVLAFDRESDELVTSRIVAGVDDQAARLLLDLSPTDATDGITWPLADELLANLRHHDGDDDLITLAEQYACFFERATVPWRTCVDECSGCRTEALAEWTQILGRVARVAIYPTDGTPRKSKKRKRGSVTVTTGIADVVEHLRVVDVSAGHCMCVGEVGMDLFDADRDLLASITVHHGDHIRRAGWPEDAFLPDGPGLVAWLRDQGVSIN